MRRRRLLDTHVSAGRVRWLVLIGLMGVVAEATVAATPSLLLVIANVAAVAALVVWTSLRIDALQARAANLGAQARLDQAALASLDEPLVVLALDGTVARWNAAAARCFGRTHEVAIGRRFASLVGSELAAEAASRAARAARGEPQGPWDLPAFSAGGPPRDLALTFSAVRDAAGARVGVVVAARDTTAERQGEVQFRAVVEACPSGVLVVDGAGAIALANTEAARMFGDDRLVGRAIDSLLPARFRGGHQRLRAEFTAAPTARKMGVGREVHGVRADGGEFPLEIGLSPLCTAEGTFTLATLIDITERKRQEDDLRRSNAELEQFAYVASHDLQEPLRMIANFTELLGRRYRGQLDERADKYIHYVVDGAKRMQRLIADLLEYSQVGSQAKPFARVELQAIFEQVRRTFEPAIREAGAVVEATTPLPAVFGDEGQLRQLLQNLIANALKFRADRPPRVAVAAARKGGRWELSVADNGIGIEAQYAERIFQMFERLHARGEFEGSGIGLAIAKRIVERHGGRIWFESTPGAGATFFALLPAPPAEGKA